MIQIVVLSAKITQSNENTKENRDFFDLLGRNYQTGKLHCSTLIDDA